MKYLKKFNESYSKDDLLDVLANLSDFDCDIKIWSFDESLPISEQSEIKISISKVINLKYSDHNTIIDLFHNSYSPKGYTEELFHKQYVGSYSEKIEIDDCFSPKKVIKNNRKGGMKELEEKEYDFILNELIILYRFLYGKFSENNNDIYEPILAFIDFKIVNHKGLTKLNFYFNYLNYNLSDLD